MIATEQNAAGWWRYVVRIERQDSVTSIEGAFIYSSQTEAMRAGRMMAEFFGEEFV